MSDPINQIDQNIRSKWRKGFLWGFTSAILLFSVVIKVFPMWFEKILREDYVPLKEYNSLKDFKKDSNKIDKIPDNNNTPKNSNTQIGKDNSNTQQ